MGVFSNEFHPQLKRIARVHVSSFRLWGPERLQKKKKRTNLRNEQNIRRKIAVYSAFRASLAK